MDQRALTHELTRAHAVLRTRRRIAAAEPGWATSASDLAALSKSREEEGCTEAPARGTALAPSTWGGAWRRRAGRVGGWHDIQHQVTLRRLSLSGRGHQPRRVALLPLSAEPAHGGRDAGRPRHRREP